MKTIICLLLLLSIQVSGQGVQNFTLNNVIDSKPVTLNNSSSQQGVLVIFTSNSCPFDQYYLDRIKTIADEYKESIRVLLINSYIDQSESMEAMKEYARQCNLLLPYLADKDQQVIKMFDAKKSPEAFLLKNTGGNFSIVYRGAIDDNAQTASEVRNAYLKNAIDQLVAREEILLPTVRPVGCSIRRD